MRLVILALVTATLFRARDAGLVTITVAFLAVRFLASAKDCLKLAFFGIYIPDLSKQNFSFLISFLIFTLRTGAINSANSPILKTIAIKFQTKRRLAVAGYQSALFYYCLSKGLLHHILRLSNFNFRLALLRLNFEFFQLVLLRGLLNPVVIGTGVFFALGRNQGARFEFFASLRLN